MKILVTGGLGYIGSHTVVELQNEGFEVVIIDNLSNSRIEVLDGIEKITGKKPQFKQLDLKDKNAIEAFFLEHKEIAGVIHFAASKAVGESVLKPLYYYENNVNGLIHLLKAYKNLKTNNFIFSSSCTVYGEADQMPIKENAPIKPAASPYGNTKQIGEALLSDICKIDENFNVISLRYFNPIGAHPTAQIGELPMGIPQNLVPYITQTAIGIRDELAVFGNDYPTSDGTCIRDYIHVVDIAKAHVISLQRLVDNMKGKNYEVFNLGTGKGSSVMEVMASFERVSNTSLNYKIADRRKGDVSQAYADTEKANKILGWKAKSTLDDAILSAWKWEQSLNSRS